MTQFLNNTTALPNADVAGMVIDSKELDTSSLVYRINNNGPNAQINDFIYKNRDQHFYHSIQYDSRIFYNGLITLHEGGNLHRTAVDGKTPSNGYIPITNYIQRKYIHINAKCAFWNSPTDCHYAVFRYGRTLLNKAEALFGLARYDASKMSSAMTTFSQACTTHDDLPPSIATSLTDAWNDCETERHVDLTLEGDYYQSLLYWGMYGGETNHGKPTGDIIPELDSSATFTEISQDRRHMFVGTVGYTNADRIFSKRRHLPPIIQNIINANSTINDGDQNPGW